MHNRIKEVRKALNLTQTDFGAKIGVKGNTITNYESGLRTPSDAVIFSICREFGVDENWLRTGEGEMLVQQTRDEKIANFMRRMLKEEGDTFKKRLINLLCALDEDDWEALEKIARKMEKGEY